MALVVKDRVKETTTSTGTGTVTLAGATQGYQSFSVVGDGNTTYYTITDGTNWEVGIGTYTASGTTLSRDTILESSNSGSAVNFSAGVKDVFVTYPAEKAVTLDGTETLTNKTINASNNTVTNVSLTTGVTGTLPVANGGTGATSLTSGYVLKGNGTSPLSASVIYDNGTNVAIGGTTANARLEVLAPATTSSDIAFFSNSAGSQKALFRLDAQGDGELVLRDAGNYEDVVITAGGDSYFNGGDVGIGTSSPDAKLHVSTNSATPAVLGRTTSDTNCNIEYRGSATSVYAGKGAGDIWAVGSASDLSNATTTKFVVDTGNGNVGIGNTNPSGKLHVGSTSGATPSSTADDVVADTSGNTGISILSGTSSLGSIHFGDSGSSNVGILRYDHSTNSMLAFTNATERLRITSAGDVGIGTTSPLGQLEVANETASDNQDLQAFFTTRGTGTGSDVILNLVCENTTTGETFINFGDSAATDAGQLRYNHNGDSMAFRTNSAERLRITSAGSVGIGTTSPDSKVDIEAANSQLRLTDSDDSKFVEFSYSGGKLITRNNSTSTTVNQFTLDESGRLGIGTISPSQTLQVQGTGYATSDFRAPRFYDSNNTAYYVDAASTSVLNGLTANAPDFTGEVYTSAPQDSWAFRATTGSSNNSSGLWFSGVVSMLLLRDSSGTIKTRLAANGSTNDNQINGNPIHHDGYAPFNNLTSKTSGTGTYQTSGDFRAPIFYDSNNTAYFADPSSGSKLFDLTVEGTGHKYLIINSSNGNEAMVRYIGGSGSSWYVGKRLTTQLVGTESFHFYSQAAGATVAGIDTSGNIFSSGSVRSPIFYDTDNTGYYANPAGTSEFSSLTLSGTQFWKASNGAYQRVDSRVESTNYARAHWYGVTSTGGTTNFRHAWYNGSSYINVTTDATGVDFAGTLRSALLYDRDNTAYYVNPAGTSVLSSAQFDGIVRIATGSVGPANTTDGLMFDGNYINGQYRHRFRKRDDSGGIPLYLDYAAGTANSYTELMKFGPNTADGSYLTVYGIISSNTDIRAPRFYDSDNTAYYVDPASRSQLSNITVTSGAGEAGIRFRGNTLDFVGRYSNYVSLYNQLGGELKIFDSGYLNSSVYGQFAGSLRAPIFYDTDNTGYNLNANGSAWQLQTPSGYLRAGPMNTGFCHFNTDRPRYYFDKEVQFDNGINDYSGNWRFNDSLGQHDVSLRSPLFYDSNNTAYYIHADGTSVLNGLTVQGRNWTGGISGAQNYVASSTSTSNRGNYGSGVWAYSGYSTGTNRPFTYDATLQVMPRDNLGFEISADWVSPTGTPLKVRSLRDCCQGWSTWVDIATSSHSFTNSVDLRAPIFYDSNNTGYYVDPASGAYVSGEFGVKQSGTNGFRIYSPTGTQSLWVRAGYDTNGTATPISSPTNIQFQSSGSVGGSFTFVSGNTKALTITSNYAQGAGSLRAPIFYDSDNTGFYLNPASTSYLNTVSLGAQTWRGHITWNNGQNIYVGGESSFDVSSGGTWQVWDSTSSLPFIKCPAGSNVEIGQAGSRGLYVYGSITATGNVTAYSDIRVKANVKQIEGALDKVQAIRGVTYNRTDLEDTERRYGGVIAQEIEKVLPEAIFENDDRKAVDYNATIGLLIEAIKELKAEVETLKKG